MVSVYSKSRLLDNTKILFGKNAYQFDFKIKCHRKNGHLFRASESKSVGPAGVCFRECFRDSVLERADQ